MSSGKASPPILRQGRGRLNRLKQAAARREVKEGYPVEPRNFTAEEVEQYFSGDKITCLLCGRSYKSLAIHLGRIHSMTGDEYRLRYGLPFRRGIAAEAVRAAHSARSSSPENIARIIAQGDENRHLAHAAIKENGVRRPAYHQDHSTRQALAIAGRDRVYEHADFERFLDAIKTGMTAAAVAKLDGMPGSTRWHEYLRDNPTFAEQVARELDALPFATQAVIHCLGARFRSEIERLRGEGLTQYQIADRLGVSQSVVSLHEAEMNAEGG